jgi:hypothetical protein
VFARYPRLCPGFCAVGKELLECFEAAEPAAAAAAAAGLLSKVFVLSGLIVRVGL